MEENYKIHAIHGDSASHDPVMAEAHENDVVHVEITGGSRRMVEAAEFYLQAFRAEEIQRRNQRIELNGNVLIDNTIVMKTELFTLVVSEKTYGSCF